MVNIRKVASKAGVSAATVSRAFNNSNLVDLKTKRRVLKVARGLSYYPDRNTPGPKRPQNKIFGFLVPRTEERKTIYYNINFYSGVFAGFKEAMDEYDDQILSISYISNALEDVVPKVNWRDIQGLALIHTSLKDDEFIKRNVASFKVPFVVLNRRFSEEMINYICFDEELGGYEATNYLSNLGHRWIGCLALRQDFIYLQERANGYKKAMMKLWPKDTTEKLIGYCKEISDSYEETKALLKKEKRISALFLNEEELVPGVFKAVQELGRRVPEDISIVAYNDYGYSLSVKPQLTTIRLLSKEMGYLAGRMLQDIRKVDIRGIFRILLRPQLIERDSCLKRE